MENKQLRKWQLSLSELVWSAIFVQDLARKWTISIVVFNSFVPKSSRPAALTPSMALLKSPEIFTPSGFWEDLGGSLVDINWPLDIFGTCHWNILKPSHLVFVPRTFWSIFCHNFPQWCCQDSILILTSSYSWMPSCRVDDSLLGGAVQDHLNTPFWAHGSAWRLWTQRLGLTHGHMDLGS